MKKVLILISCLWIASISAHASAAIAVSNTRFYSGTHSRFSSNTRRGRVVVKSVKFYSGKRFDYASCTRRGHASHSFSHRLKHINVLDTFSEWLGPHTDRDRWYSPNGKLYFQSSANKFVGSGPTKDCGQLNVAGTDAQHIRGRWTYRLVVDGRVRKTAHFKLK